ncbi:MAG: hypothetical protein DMG49_16640 [Acidobacteria bacterium]|nr:MAG: hypothetical protein DMG49_16640 [Acidobacteriota bacterium]
MTAIVPRRSVTPPSWGVYPDEQITSRDGGMIVTNDSKVAALAKKLCNQGSQRIRRMVPAGKSWATTTDSPN